MASIFSKIVNGEIPSYKVYEDENFFAFLDINPLALGHVLLVPKKEIDYIFDIDNDVLSLMLPVAKRISKAMEKAISCRRIGIAVIGLEVPHAHIHLIPLNNVDDINFSKPKLKVSDEELQEILDLIKSHL